MTRIACCVVTWNRRDDVARVVGAIAGQTAGPGLIDLVVIDNASTDGTLEHLLATWSPDRIVENPTDRAHEPRFAPGEAHGPNRGGFASMTVVRNSANHGGCGGFNTGLAFVDAMLEVDYLWFVDDDADLEPDTLERLLEAMAADGSIGLVGSRTCNINDRAHTIETTIYFNQTPALMADEPEPAHRLHAEHAAWAREVGGTRGTGPYRGVRDVDIVSACCLLSRWRDVQEVGFWDKRYFIYCDDADWALRFGRAGKRVVVNLDAVVYHTPWHHKLTPARLYYAQRNLLFTLQKMTPLSRARRMVWTRSRALLLESLKAMLFNRLDHAEIIRRSVADALDDRGGTLEADLSQPEPLADAIARTGLAGRRAVLICNRPATLQWAAALREQHPEVQWLELAHGRFAGEPAPSRHAYAEGRKGRLVEMLRRLLRPPRAAVVFDNGTDLPILRARWNLHFDPQDPSRVRVERNGVGRRLGWLARWLATAARSLKARYTLPPYCGTDRYG